MRAIKHGLDHDRLHHAYLFAGTRGVGKTTIARIVAKGLNCETGVTSTPCGECSVCVEVQENRFIDLIEVDAASRTGVGDTRELLENAQYRPTRGRYKVYLIDEVHMLSAAAFNALLKTLEEPPEHVKFLLATTDPRKVPITVLSRCLQFQLKNISREKIAAHLADVLNAESVKFEQAALEIIAAAARGSMRDALSIADQAVGYGQGSLMAGDVAGMLGAVGRNEVQAVIDAVASTDAGRIVQICDELADQSTDFDAALTELIGELHRLAVESAVGSGDGPFSPEALQLFYQIAVTGYRDVNVVPEPRMAFEMTLLRMLAFAPDEGSAGKVAASRPTERGDAYTNAAPDAAAPDAVDESQPKGGGDDHEMWCEMVARLRLSGVAQSLTQDCVLLAAEDDCWRLLLDESRSLLLNDGVIASVKRAIEEEVGRPVSVDIMIGPTDLETPAARRARVQTELQARAERVFENDDTVQSLLKDFDGRLDRVRPVNAGSGGG